MADVVAATSSPGSPDCDAERQPARLMPVAFLVRQVSSPCCACESRTTMSRCAARLLLGRFLSGRLAAPMTDGAA
jgi:hypothetical protein